ncbi:MAG: response regulator [Cyanobacteria bacterium J06650_10]
MAKILIIEDEVDIRANLLELLKLEGYDVMSADNGVTGLIGAMEYQPDLVLCDVMMPELDGHDVLLALRQEPQTALIPFIFLTAFADKGDIRQGMDLGADDYLTKPFTCTEVLGAVKTRLKKQTVITADQRDLRSQLLLNQKLAQQFQQGLDPEKLTLMKDFRLKTQETLEKLQTVTQLLQQLPEHAEKDRSLDLIQNICASEIKMLTRVPNLDYLETEWFEV